MHSTQQCLDLGGNNISVEGTIKLCQFNLNQCPSGWLQYKNWGETTKTSCGSPDSSGIGCNSKCTTGFHIWNNLVPETCMYKTGSVDYSEIPPKCARNTNFNLCVARYSKIGCY